MLIVVFSFIQLVLPSQCQHGKAQLEHDLHVFFSSASVFISESSVQMEYYLAQIPYPLILLCFYAPLFSDYDFMLLVAGNKMIDSNS